MIAIFKKVSIALIVLIFIIGGLFYFSNNSKSYNDKTTHPGLTDEMVDFYNLYFDDELTTEEKEWIVQGSIDEDTPPRWINHFYDPITGEGWEAENLGEVSQLTLKIFSRIFLNNNTEIVSSKNWVHNEVLQLKYQDYGGNRTWENAMRRYVNGDKEYAYRTLGHILHLLEDKTVPDHTRNDTHAHEGSRYTEDGGSPYEDYSSRWNRLNLTMAQDLKNENKSPVSLNSIDDYIDYLADYSNRYFFSEHTINSSKYDNPKILREDDNYGYGQDKDGNEFSLVNIKFIAKENFNTEKIYTLKDNENNNLVLSLYFSSLSRAAVLNGAGAIKLFKEEVARAEKDRNLIKEEPEISWWQKTRSPLYGFIIPAYDTAHDIYTEIKEIAKSAVVTVRENVGSAIDMVAENMKSIFSQLQPIDPMVSVANIGQQLENLNQDAIKKNQDVEGQMTLANEGQASGFDKNIIGPQVQQGQQPQEIRQSQPQPQNQSQPEIIHAPFYRAPEVIHAPYQGRQEIAVGIPDDNTPSQTFIFTGGGPDNQSGKGQDLDDKTVQDDDDTDEDNQDQNQDNLPDPNNEPDEQPKQEEPKQEEPKQDEPKQEDPQPQPDPDPILPDINFYLTEYDVRKSDFILNWEDRNNVAQRWELEYNLGPNFNWASIVLANRSELIANSYVFAAEYDDLTYYFRLRVQYDGSNFSDWVELPVDISSKPVVINEIAWMGTQASHDDEWIELANKTDQEINLADWVLKISNGNSVRDVNLTGKIAPNGFYLLERTNDETIPNISADQIFTGAISNNEGAWIELDDANNVLIDNAYTVSAGENGSKKTSERVSIWTAGINKNNWKTYSGQGGVAQDADENAILGTPRAENYSADEFLALNVSPDKSRIFLKSRGTILIENGIQIPAGIKMLIEPGSVLKFGYQGSLTVLGELVAKGMAEENIVFTSTSDDMYGADINGDDPIITSWMGVNFSESSKGELDNIILKNVGSVWISNAVSINKANVKISNSIFENNSENVLVFDYANADISSSEFRNNIGHAVSVAYASANISSSIFKDNTGAGLWFGGSDGDVSISSSSFTGNKVPVETNRLTDFSMTGNTMSNNASNGILVYGGVAEDKSSITISADMPFVFVNSGSVDEGKTLNLSPGTVFKFEQRFFNVYGSLNAIGTSEQLVVFTSLNDDVYGGDANNDGDATMPGANSWYGIHFMDGENSILDNVIVKYAGLGSSGVYVEPEVGNFILRNSTISDSVIGATIASDDATIENVIVSSNSEIGLNVAAGNVMVSDATFQSNGKAFQSSSAHMDTVVLSNLIFDGNANNYFIDGNTYDAWPEDLTVPLP